MKHRFLLELEDLYQMACLLEHGEMMIKKFTYKELTLILGILVALIIVFALWIYQPAGARTTYGAKRHPVVEVFKKSVIKTYVTVADELR